MASQPQALRDHQWDVCYSHEDGDLVSMFYLPALGCAKLYRRATGYFSGSVMVLAARGLDALIERGGQMELLVGCTLTQNDIEQIEKGYDVREHVGRTRVNQLAFEAEDRFARRHIGYLAWMIAHGFLDVKLAIPLDEAGKMRAGLSLYHAKMGLLTDEAGDQLAFKGSINETEQGWRTNCESFDVSCSWRGEWDRQKVSRSASEFGRLWSCQARSARVVSFPEALRERLLEFLPKDDTFTKPPRTNTTASDEDDATDVREEDFSADERRRLIWSVIAHAAEREEDGPSYTVATSAVEPWPHQLRTFDRMLRAWPFRLLIADEVGLGKTIEAGLLIRHAWISGLARRILIMTPAGVCRQWQAELYEKFNLLVPIYTGSSLLSPAHHGQDGTLEKKISRKDWTKAPCVLVSSHLMRRRERQQELVQAEPWDLMVLDEAHHARRGGAGTAQERGPNRLLRLMHSIKDKAASLLLMTATPMQVHPVELWDLMNVLGLPAVWTEDAFIGYFDLLSRNPDERQLFDLAELFRASRRYQGALSDDLIARVAERCGLSNLGIRKVMDALAEEGSTIPLKRLDSKQRQAAIAVLKAGTPLRSLMSRHTRHLLRAYHQKGLLGSPIARRAVTDMLVQLTAAERQLYEDVENYISATYEKAPAGKRNAVGFVMTVYRRRLASSFHALRQTLQNRLERILNPKIREDDLRLEEDVSQDEQVLEAMAAPDVAELEGKSVQFEQTGQIQILLKAIAKLGTDTKARVLVEQLGKLFRQGCDAVLVFTQYTDTMDFLKEHLGEKLHLAIGCFSGRGGERRDQSGAWVACSKEQIKRLVRDGQISVLLCTDAAGEGLNLQYAGALVNYDLPWNPMKVEQRIGRIDRIGQVCPEIRILNLAYADTVEADVYFALSDRIGLFNGFVGKLQPILSCLPREFEAAALRRAEEREKGRHEALQNITNMVTDAEQAAFDIDEVSDADLVVPAMPPSPVTADDMDRVLHNVALLPPGAECVELEPSTYSLRLPGQEESLRVTSSPGIFEDHFESHQLVSADGPMFKRLVAMSGVQPEDDKWRGIARIGDLLGRRS